MVYDPRIRAGIFAGESGGDYNALFGYQNRPDGRFSDINLTSMPISDVLAFTDPSGPYAQYVKGQVGRVATPVGAYQVVGSTLRDAVNALGIDPSTPFNQATQDRIGQWILENQGTGAWEGYRPNASPVQISTSGVNAMPMTPQQPMGLLGQLGIQKQDQMAADQTALPFYQRDQFKDTMGSLAMAFNELRMNPSQAIPQAVMAGRQRRATDQQNNRTVEWLRSQPNGEQFAQLAEAVGAGPALQMYQEAIKGPDQTAGQQNFAEYQRILATQGQEAADMFLKVAGNGGTSISLGGELSPEDKGRQQYNVERLGKLADIGGAQQALGQVQLLGQYLEAGGSGFGQGLAKFVKDTTGLDFQDAPSAAANALISQLIPAQRPQGSGSASDSDMRLFAAALPSMSTSMEGNRLIVQGMEALAKYKYDMALIAAEYMAGRIDSSQADQAIIALGNPLENIMDQVKSFQSAPSSGGGAGGNTGGGTTSGGLTWSIE